MKTLTAYKQEYSKAKTSKGKQSAFNRAMLNLNQSDGDKFYKWQCKQMNQQPQSDGHTFILPTWSLPYLVNSDPSGLTDEEIEQIDSFVKQYSRFEVIEYSEPYFSWRNDINSMGGDVVECLVLVD